ncbi:MAG: glutaredoxin family protein [gamma proteobacterium symbiont of Ctena orbiculata]|nr:glutaredoxin family protein [Candidatus Thiodiazotropha taylori]MBT3059385.1 glutaredoxin family protein [Candidatus Thiodiazotropha sp. (ex Lucina pensylvanica)]MBT3062184.1 glutaredoxin family protein [Candidatus Thiodiazotropha sp. (ex Lucina pensylvanica)]MBV2094666.1 glutaredoxin family protein [Candidatus Thiodiazotropha sp. (ex Codakia orbicularis)]
MSPLRFYYREGCHLCDDMLQELKRLQTEWRFELIEIDIDRYPEIRDSYDTRIPLLEDNQGRCLSEYFLDQASLLSYLQGA